MVYFISDCFLFSSIKLNKKLKLSLEYNFESFPNSQSKIGQMLNFLQRVSNLS